MSDITSYLSGRIIRHRVPVIENPETAPPTGLRRLPLPQGELAQFYCSDSEPIRTIAYIELRAGTVRGHHYHQQRNEYIYLLRGELELTVEDIQTKQRERVPLQAGDLVYVPRNIAHALAIKESGHAIEFAAALFDRQDTYRYRLE